MEEREEAERRFRRVIGSAGVDAILSSIPHQPPPGNLYPPLPPLPLFLSYRTHTATVAVAATAPSATRHPPENDANTKQPFPPKMETDESWSTIFPEP